MAAQLLNLNCTRPVAGQGPARLHKPTAARCNCVVPQQRSCFGKAAALAGRQTARQARSCLVTRAFRREWPDPELIEECREAFPDEGIANVEQARALFSSLGYTYLDVRPSLEYEEVGRVKGSVNIGIKISKRVYNAEQKKKVIEKSDNKDFVKQVEKRFPDKKTKLLIGCSDGRTYSIDALEALDDAGYTNLVGLKGGYYAWFRVFDNKLGRRRTGEYAENYTHDGDSCGIHSSGAGFDRVDPADSWVPPNY